MKKHFLVFLSITGLGLLSWGTAQSSKSDLFDLKRSQQELEIMKGVLATTLSFAANDLRGRETGASAQQHEHYLGSVYGSLGGSNIGAFYLYGQGATFIIPVSSFRFAVARSGRVTARLSEPEVYRIQQESLEASLDAMEENMEALNHELEAEQAQLQAAVEAKTRQLAEELAYSHSVRLDRQLDGSRASGVSGGVAGGMAGAAQTKAKDEPKLQEPAPPAPPAPPKPPKPVVNREEIRKRLFETQEKMKQSRIEMAERRKKLLESISEIKVYLIEALARHGDSLSQLKPNEYINIIITTDDGFPMVGGGDESRAQREVISVQKSVITDYKTGKLTSDGFRQKVLQYGT